MLKECRLCGFDFDPAGRPAGKRDVCRNCENDVQLVQGDMIWTHKTAPVLQIRGRQAAITPQEHAAMRRR